MGAAFAISGDGAGVVTTGAAGTAMGVAGMGSNAIANAERAPGRMATACSNGFDPGALADTVTVPSGRRRAGTAGSVPTDWPATKTSAPADPVTIRSPTWLLHNPNASSRNARFLITQRSSGFASETDRCFSPSTHRLSEVSTNPICPNVRGDGARA